MRELMRAGTSAAMVLGLMVGGSLVLWIGVPVAWLYIGSQVQAETDSLGTALLVMFVGAIASVVAIAMALAWLNRKHVELREARGLESYGSTVLEAVMVVSATLALVAFVFWLLVLQGPGPSLAPSG
jgi:hypothetical protein